MKDLQLWGGLAMLLVPILFVAWHILRPRKLCMICGWPIVRSYLRPSGWKHPGRRPPLDNHTAVPAVVPLRLTKGK
jgi:hypothetical protein